MKRPLSVTIVGWFFILAGAVGFVYHLSELNVHDLFSDDSLWILLVRVLAIVGGILCLRGMNAGRWLLVIWMAYHVGLSYFHSVSEMVTHAILLAVIVVALFHRTASGYFQRLR
jgi:Trk-type K+ transport system membrane component